MAFDFRLRLGWRARRGACVCADHVAGGRHYLAVEAASPMPGDVIQPLWQNMINAQTGSGFLLPSAWNPGRMRCIMIYDTRISAFATKRGFLVVETPHLGGLARFGDYIALYIRTG